MKDNNIRALSKEELIGIVYSEYKSARIVTMIAYIVGAEALVYLLEYFAKVSLNEQPFAHFSTILSLTLGLAVGLAGLVNRVMTNSKKIEALTELLRQSNIIG